MSIANLFVPNDFSIYSNTCTVDSLQLSDIPNAEVLATDSFGNIIASSIPPSGTISAGPNINITTVGNNSTISVVGTPTFGALSVVGTTTSRFINGTTQITSPNILASSVLALTNLPNATSLATNGTGAIIAGSSSSTTVSAGTNISVTNVGSNYQVSTVASPSFTGVTTGLLTLPNILGANNIGTDGSGIVINTTSYAAIYNTSDVVTMISVPGNPYPVNVPISFDYSTSDWSIPSDGILQYNGAATILVNVVCSFSGIIASPSTSTFNAYIFQNGSQLNNILTSTSSTSVDFPYCLNTFIQLNTGDQIQLFVQMSTGLGSSFETDNFYLTAVRIG